MINLLLLFKKNVAIIYMFYIYCYQFYNKTLNFKYKKFFFSKKITSYKFFSKKKFI